MKKILFLLFALVTTLTGCQQQSGEKRIGVIVPIQHKAMDDITNGITETLHKEAKTPVKFKIANAQGDMNMQRAIIQQMKDENYDVIIPIGLAATQMSVAMIHNTPIVSAAASYPETERQNLKPCNLAVVDDEISPDQIINFVHLAYPNIKNITLVHSASEKVFPEVRRTVTAGNKLGITITPKMISSLSELYVVSNALPKNTQAIFVLKDNLVVSGINTLAMIAEKNSIPLITSDQGSVQENAALALGVHERDIGVEAGKLTAEILSGKQACSLPIVVMKDLTVFVNRSALQKEKQTLENITTAAKQQNYKIEFVDTKG